VKKRIPAIINTATSEVAEITIFRRICHIPVYQNAGQQEPSVVDVPAVEVVPVVGVVSVVETVPVVEDIPVIEDVPLEEHGVVLVEVGTDGLRVKMLGGGLRPPAPSSVEPNGIPTRPTDDADPILVGDESDAAGPAREVLPVVIQVPDAVPARLPPSNRVVELDGSVVEVPVLKDVPVVPKDVCGSEAPMPEHDRAAVAVDVSGDVPDVRGLTPGVASSVAPRGMPVGGTGKAGPMPSGDVTPSGKDPGEMLTPPTCAKAGP
jgi:hypothetical protein